MWELKDLLSAGPLLQHELCEIEKTWYNWIEYLLIVYVPLTVFDLIILFF